MLIHGDNLLALKALEQDYSNKIKCIYIDPPYNTGNAFEHYDDGVEHSLGKDIQLYSNSAENNVTYPTDAKQYKRVIDDVNRISEQEDYAQRQRYTRISNRTLEIAVQDGTELSVWQAITANEWEETNFCLPGKTPFLPNY